MLLSLLLPALANERRFAYTYETPALPAGAVEIEPWVTLVPGADNTGLSFRHRLEFELGVTDRLLTALYLNWSAGPGSFTWAGVSSEWKYTLLSRVVAPIGLALYAEGQLGPEEWELEAKVLADIERGPFVAAVDLVGEYEARRDLALAEDGTLSASWEGEYLVQAYVAGSYEVAGRLGLGAEARSSTRIRPEDTVQTTLAVGPALAWRTPGWWAATTFLPRVAAIVPTDDTLIDDQPWEYRVLLGFHL